MENTGFVMSLCSQVIYKQIMPLMRPNKVICLISLRKKGEIREYQLN